MFIYFGAGCFWGVEAEFRQLEGVLSTSVGYMGGTLENPTYEEVCTDLTGHAEVVEVEYDPSKLQYKDLLEIFFNLHDPTQLNRQGPDVGTQYRSVIFYENEDDKSVSKDFMDSISTKYTKPIVTSLEKKTKYYVAEEYHQKYLEKRGLSSCHSGLA
ncbi:MAG: peptide-methionine (S)-S-oxide reductase MsrA [Actinomycetota bacterium]|nr:peptide-methionine (S)-S-oxide reductase MsrA [Actinomycetota bacterium]